MSSVGKMLMVVGAILFLIGLLWRFIGKLPGDIVLKKGNTVFFFPIVTSIILSIGISLLLYIVNVFFKR
ncbi:DUF2905 family protein [Terrilactibacillus sp. BCM23-1]|uniref:DUF2905 family protein n=1 Tax=Terrilactibacillus tamarindi TaxID=2599694 RepID=A0A6N8CRX4_9BACI|nr:DUF2905 domain-containing protein [Terrilactibacillus tamarindi]MTT32430.1 DUF2905 family protein [Terrilactibacillus tamarindi]